MEDNSFSGLKTLIRIGRLRAQLTVLLTVLIGLASNMTKVQNAAMKAQKNSVRVLTPPTSKVIV